MAEKLKKATFDLKGTGEINVSELVADSDLARLEGIGKIVYKMNLKRKR